MKIRMTTTEPASVTWSLVSSPLGNLAVGLTNKGEICLLSFARGRKPAEYLAEWQAAWSQTKFVQGKALKDILSMPILLVGTPFQQTVWKAMAEIRRGQVATYGSIAKRIRRPKAFRAVGAACGANPVPYLVPCHRVIAANGGLGGFSGGLGIKEKLLKIEGYL